MATEKDSTAVLVEGMIAHGMAPFEAVSVALALKFAAQQEAFAALYGTFTQEHLQGVIAKLSNTA